MTELWGLRWMDARMDPTRMHACVGDRPHFIFVNP